VDPGVAGNIGVAVSAAAGLSSARIVVGSTEVQNGEKPPEG
jgi:hypothetical protein